MDNAPRIRALEKAVAQSPEDNELRALLAATVLFLLYLGGILAITLLSNRWSLDPRDE